MGDIQHYLICDQKMTSVYASGSLTQKIEFFIIFFLMPQIYFSCSWQMSSVSKISGDAWQENSVQRRNLEFFFSPK